MHNIHAAQKGQLTVNTTKKQMDNKPGCCTTNRAGLALLFLLSGGALAYPDLDTIAPTQALSPPEFSTLDRNFVDVASGQVSITLQDVAIGNGPLSLTHTISTHTSDFVNFEDVPGPHFRYYGGIKKRQLRSRGAPGYLDDLYVLQYFDFQGSIDFEILGQDSNGIYQYRPISDDLSSLSWESGVYTLTKADGTVVTIPGGAFADTDYSHVNYGWTQITFPNGFQINAHRRRPNTNAPVESITTNTGLQLVYQYELDSGTLPPATPGNPYNNVTWPSSNIRDDGFGWDSIVPSSVVAINRAYEYCSDDTSVCNLTQVWPTATYHWPQGMPKAAYVADSVFSVTDSAGRVTEYHHTPFDIDFDLAGISSPQTRFTVRLKSVKFAGQTQPSVEYGYVNVMDPTPQTNQTYTSWAKNIGPGTLRSAVQNGDTDFYTVGARAVPTDTGGVNLTQSGGAHKGISSIVLSKAYGVPVRLSTWDRDIQFVLPPPITGANAGFIPSRVDTVTHRKEKNVVTTYGYDSRGNINSVSDVKLGARQAFFPSSCTNTKTCNKPEWTTDGKHQKTEYTWHSESGQIERITRPAKTADKRSSTYYSYLQYHGAWKDNNNHIIWSPTPVWLLHSETSCRTGTLASDNTCDDDGTAIVTTYHYGPQNTDESQSVVNNLWMRGMTVTADGESRTTCYTYDKTGNRLSETSPKAGLTTCN